MGQLDFVCGVVYQNLAAENKLDNCIVFGQVNVVDNIKIVSTLRENKMVGKRTSTFLQNQFELR